MIRSARLALIVAFATVLPLNAACGHSAPSTSAPASSTTATATAPSAVVVHTHAAGDKAFRSNAYLVETPHGVVAVDAPFTVSESRAFRAELDALRKPLLAVLVTHAHPDHVNGVRELVRGQSVPILALKGVEQTLRAIDGPKRAYWAPIYGDEYPKETAFPTRIVSAREPVVLDGVTVTALDLGQGESEDEGVWLMDSGGERAAFVGDLVLHKVHAWLAEGHSRAWLSALDRAPGLLGDAAVVYPGHGPVGDREALAWQKAYIEAYRAAVRELAHGAPSLDDAKKKALEAKMNTFLPGGPLAMLVAMSADAIAAELAKEASSPVDGGAAVRQDAHRAQ